MARKTSTTKPAKPGPDPFRDPPTIARIRAVRARMLRDAGGTLDGLTRLAQQEAAAFRNRSAASSHKNAA